ncbi:hypothetical protein AFA91_02185 [Mycolicibacterium goodii]|uniref:Terpene synthase n=1 Tax=Mycolicibacterium goodii TaxID=134601 RepID=A0A0K0X0A4_MYCGD|nr:hypothetical protein AFA91_02185 [Mycolicibacterium goodii]
MKEKPDAQKYQAASEKFFEACGFDAQSLRTTKAMGTGRLASYYAPEGDEEGVQLLSDWLMWALLFDDAYCDDGDIARDPSRFGYVAASMMTRCLNPRELSAGDDTLRGFEMSLQDIFSRVEARSGYLVASAIGLEHFQWMVGAYCGVSDRVSSHLRNLDEHLIVRPMDGGNASSLYFTQVASRRWLNADYTSMRAVRAITHASIVLLTVPTDIASYGWERHQRSLESNIVAIIANERGCSIPEAIDHSRHFVEQIMQVFLDLKAQLVRLGDPELDGYLEDMSNIVRGTLEWQRLLPRYILSPQQIADVGDNGFDVQPIHEVSHDRSFTTPFPRPKSIQWYWDALDE